MAQKTRAELKTIWATGATMTEVLFDDVWDSFQNISDDGTGPDIPEIKGTSINWVPPSASIGFNPVNTLSTVIKATPFTVYGNVSSTGVVIEGTGANAPGVLHMALYKYDYDADIWNIATEQLDASMVATGMIVQSFTTPQALTPGKYCVAWRCNLSGASIRAFYKKSSTLNFSGSDVSSTNWMNIMVTNAIAYNATMPTALTFPPANFLNSTTHENIQIKF